MEVLLPGVEGVAWVHIVREHEREGWNSRNFDTFEFGARPKGAVVIHLIIRVARRLMGLTVAERL